MKPSSFVLAAAAAVLLGVAVRGADWTEFRGPTGQGLAGDVRLPVEWGPTKNVAWKQEIPGKGWSSPVVADGHIYLTTAVPADGGKDGDLSLQALCLDAASGKILWAKEVFREDGAKAPKPHPKNSHASPTPLLHGNRLYVHFGHMGTACLDLDGKVLWRNDELRYTPQHGNGGTPILVDDELVLSCDGVDKRFVVALDCDTGKVRWKTKRTVDATRGFSFNTPLLIAVKDQHQIVSVGSNMVGAYDPKTGEEIWRVRHEGWSVVPKPVYGNGLVYICTGFMTGKLLAIRPDGKGDVTDTNVVWKLEKNVPNTPSPLLLGDEIYLISDAGIASCLDAKTGEEHWHARLGGNFSASPIAADGLIYCQSEEGVGVVFKANKERFDLVGKNDLGEETLASYAVLDGGLLIRTETSLYRIKPR
jgi:hypothetical protein